MKVRKILNKLHKACLKHNVEKEKRLWLEALKKSLKRKNTHSIV